MEVLIEQRHLDTVKAAGPCFDPQRLLGKSVRTLKQTHLIWVEDHCPTLAAEFKVTTGLPLWCASDGSGYGYGYGYGSGYGSGYGDGSGRSNAS